MAPSGNIDCMNAAIRAGADEVYMGISGFGARRFAKNFSVQEYCDAVGEAHRYGTAVNVTLNTIMAQEEFDALDESLDLLYAAGVDAVIVQDLGFSDYLRVHYPDWPRHASTQLSIASPKEAVWAQEQGFRRLVLARELSLKEIAAIRKAVSVELEVFASGALCLACSGKCFLSSFIGGRSGNRGMCTQPCRQKYKRLDAPKGRDGFLLSSADQWQEFPEIARLFAMGVDVIKLEGRMKSPEYVFEAVRYYRGMIDTLRDASPERLENVLEKIEKAPVQTRPHPGIERLFNRGYSKGYFYEHDPDFLNTAFSASWGVKAGEIQKRRIRLTAPLRNGDGVVFLDRNLQKIDGLNVSRIVLEKTGEIVPQAPRGAEVSLGVPVPPGAALLYKTFDYELNRTLATEMKLQRRRTPIQAVLTARVGQPLRLEFSVDLFGKTFRSEAVSEEPLEASQRAAASRESLFASLDRLGETPFSLAESAAEIQFDPDVFVPKSVLNQLRQRAASDLETAIEAGMKRTESPQSPFQGDLSTGEEASPERGGGPEGRRGSETGESPSFGQNPPVSLREPAPLSGGPINGEGGPCKPILTAAVMTRAQAEACREAGIEKVYRLEPPVHFGNDVRPAWDGCAPLAGSLFDAVQLSEEKREFALDWTFHAANPWMIRYYARTFPHAGTIFLSPEISEKTVRKLAALPDTPRLGLVIYGFLYGMFTRKTLFEETLVPLQNQDGRPIWVSRNDRGENPLETSGSRVFYGNRMDISRLLHDRPVPGLAELRVDFTLETPEETTKILKKLLTRGWIQDESFSYGYEKGIF
ncbi:MAG: U32 family peptidase [Thermoguttaceae bacterium]|nr:U32 family peptidase [Thermoguttaceae bacterium]